MKKLQALIYKVDIEELIGPPDPPIEMVRFDSREVGPNDLFIAVKGNLSDGHDYIHEAVSRGATAIACESLPSKLHGAVTYVRVQDSARALGLIAANYYDHPSESLYLIGVTGTNGKTTIASLLYRLFSDLGYGCGLISTIRYLVMDREFVSSHTTPDPIQINKLLSDLVSQGGSYCFMEVSSHAVVQQRIAGLKFTGGIFTNITHDHLDYHGTFKNYVQAKKSYFDSLGKEAFALVNADDVNSKVILQNCKATKKTYALKSLADFRCKVLENQFEGLHLSFEGQELFCRMTGIFNAYNLLAIYATAILSGMEREAVLLIISKMTPVEGRFDTVRSESGITAIVDYAHTPDALKNVLETINSIRSRNEQLITVVGAGGDRDKAKRPIMGRICADKSDTLILTSDNPRTEDPDTIIRQIQEGVSPEKRRKVIIITNRREAIKAACNMARPGDIILVAGKGHEKYQEIKGERFPFDDKAILKEMLLNPNDKS